MLKSRRGRTVTFSTLVTECLFLDVRGAWIVTFIASVSVSSRLGSKGALGACLISRVSGASSSCLSTLCALYFLMKGF